MTMDRHMELHTYGGHTSDAPLHWLAARAVETFADNPRAAEAWLHRPRKDLAGFTPAQCAEIGGAPLARAASLLGRRREHEVAARAFPRADVGTELAHATR